jgi:hypothetical protein
MKLDDLKELLKKLGGKPKGRKAEIIEACRTLISEQYEVYKARRDETNHAVEKQQAVDNLVEASSQAERLARRRAMPSINANSPKQRDTASQKVPVSIDFSVNPAAAVSNDSSANSTLPFRSKYVFPTGPR